MFSNGFINACKNTIDKNIIIRVQKIRLDKNKINNSNKRNKSNNNNQNDYLLLEILNRSNEIELSEEKMKKVFTPFFLDESESNQLWWRFRN